MDKEGSNIRKWWPIIKCSNERAAKRGVKVRRSRSFKGLEFGNIVSIATKIIVNFWV